MEANIKKFYDFIKKIKSREALSNMLFLPTTLAQWAEEDKIQFIYGNDCVVLLQEDGGLLRLHYYAKNSDSMSDVYNITANEEFKRVVCDVIVKENEINTMKAIMCNNNFHYYTQFQRMSYTVSQKEQFEGLAEVEYADIKDADDILAMIKKTFDVWSAHFPTINDVRNAIERNDVYIIKQDGVIQAFGYFTTESTQMTCFNYCIVNEQARGKGFGREIWLQKATIDNRSKKIYLWVDSNNMEGIRAHVRNGLIKDGIYDLIFRLF